MSDRHRSRLEILIDVLGLAVTVWFLLGAPVGVKRAALRAGISVTHRSAVALRAASDRLVEAYQREVEA